VVLTGHGAIGQQQPQAFEVEAQHSARERRHFRKQSMDQRRVVVIARDQWSLESTRDHERVHVRQCEAWGPLFIPAYLSASLWAAVHGRSLYYGNRFEVEAYDAERNGRLFGRGNGGGR